MDDYGLVSSNPPWKWVVEKPCFVYWNSKQEGPTCLGQLSPLNSTSKLTINIGWRSDELLIALHLPVSIRASKHPRDMFMIIPCDSDTSALDMTFTPVQADGRADLPCDVIMPRAKRQKPVKGTPKELMSRLKSLSETSSFDIYFRFDTFAQLELRKIFASNSMKQLNTPLLLLDSMYDGRGGGVNLWLNQGLDLESENQKCQTHPESLQASLPPPPYTRDTIPSLDLNKPSAPLETSVDVEVPFSDVSVASLSMHKDSDGEGVPETPFWVRMRRIMDYQSPTVEHSSRANFKRAASAGSLSDSDLRLKLPRTCRSPSLGPLSREASAPVISNHDRAATVAHHEVIAQIKETDQSASLCPAPVLRETFAPSSLNIDNAGIVTQQPDSSAYRTEEFANWLFNAWTVLPSAHYHLRSQLLSLGTASAELFAEARVECTTQLAFAAACTPKSETAAACITDVSDAEEQVRKVVHWINNVRPDADMLLLHDLVALAAAAMEVVDATSEMKAEKMKDFLRRKARCIASACLLGDTRDLVVTSWKSLSEEISGRPSEPGRSEWSSRKLREQGVTYRSSI
ncbi:hypothetical protein E4T50_02358 [Aureobasidium sp. EXF-12298]|nr:hypothetical protein E4T50_02358 [Aureobasidium sp. EXF-12298]